MKIEVLLFLHFSFASLTHFLCFAHSFPMLHSLVSFALLTRALCSLVPFAHSFPSFCSLFPFISLTRFLRIAHLFCLLRSLIPFALLTHSPRFAHSFSKSSKKIGYNQIMRSILKLFTQSVKRKEVLVMMIMM